LLLPIDDNMHGSNKWSGLTPSSDPHYSQ
jgi:hypothetical protein